MTKEIIDKNGIVLARDITRKYAKTFYFASHLLPKQQRLAAYSVYAICRISDDAVDNLDNTAKLESINNIKTKIESAFGQAKLTDELLLAFRETINKFKIPKEYFDTLIEGMFMDLEKTRYEDFSELHDYCYKVAGIVGLIMLKIYGYNNKGAEEYAVDLGIAMQLTNILRDVKEDFKRGRIYLPKEELNRFGVSEEDITSKRLNSNFKNLLKFQIERAKNYYKNSSLGIKMIGSLRSRLVVCAMRDMYAGILNSIEKNNYDVFSNRAYVNKLGKISILTKILLSGQYL